MTIKSRVKAVANQLDVPLPEGAFDDLRATITWLHELNDEALSELISELANNHAEIAREIEDIEAEIGEADRV